jgi:hypothetical protein
MTLGCASNSNPGKVAAMNNIIERVSESAALSLIFVAGYCWLWIS